MQERERGRMGERPGGRPGGGWDGDGDGDRKELRDYANGHSERLDKSLTLR